MFDMNLMAVQVGAEKKTASATNKILTPAFEKITGATATALKHTPKVLPTYCYALNGDGTLGTKYTKADAASATAFAIATTGTTTTITPPTGLAEDTELLVIYEYESESGVAVTNSAKKFPKGCKFTLEVLGCDVCDQTNLLFAYLIFPNFKISPDFDWSKTCFTKQCSAYKVICMQWWFSTIQYHINCWQSLKPTKLQRMDEIHQSVNVTKVEKISWIVYG